MLAEFASHCVDYKLDRLLRDVHRIDESASRIPLLVALRKPRQAPLQTGQSHLCMKLVLVPGAGCLEQGRRHLHSLPEAPPCVGDRHLLALQLSRQAVRQGDQRVAHFLERFGVVRVRAAHQITDVGQGALDLALRLVVLEVELVGTDVLHRVFSRQPQRGGRVRPYQLERNRPAGIEGFHAVVCVRAERRRLESRHVEPGSGPGHHLQWLVVPLGRNAGGRGDPGLNVGIGGLRRRAPLPGSGVARSGRRIALTLTGRGLDVDLIVARHLESLPRLLARASRLRRKARTAQAKCIAHRPRKRRRRAVAPAHWRLAREAFPVTRRCATPPAAWLRRHGGGKT